ncbi:MAG TPA: protein translocase subunit SecD, partial [Thermomicrobiales bacterium]|nr:protein translocase subunit SecD [Thermomicrobiales bacterium]
MRAHSRITITVILLITFVSAWLAIPSDWLNIAGAKDNIYVHQGLDLQGGLQVVLEARPPEGQSVSRDELVGTRDTIQRRVGGLGVSEPLIQT